MYCAVDLYDTDSDLVTPLSVLPSTAEHFEVRIIKFFVWAECSETQLYVLDFPSLSSVHLSPPPLLCNLPPSFPFFIHPLRSTTTLRILFILFLSFSCQHLSSFIPLPLRHPLSSFPPLPPFLRSSLSVIDSQLNSTVPHHTAPHLTTPTNRPTNQPTNFITQLLFTATQSN